MKQFLKAGLTILVVVVLGVVTVSCGDLLSSVTGGSSSSASTTISGNAQ